jgi:hypothetical protein
VARGVYDVPWQEAVGSNPRRIVFTVTRIILSPPRWSVLGSVSNQTRRVLRVDRPHRPGATLFGLLGFRTTSPAELERAIRTFRYRAPFGASSFRPRLPRELRPGVTWRGVFSGLGSFEQGSYLRVEFGRFIPLGPPIPPNLSGGVIELTDNVVKLHR